MLEPGGLDPEIADWNPEEPGGSSFDPEIFDWNPEAIGEPKGYRGTRRIWSSLGTRNILLFIGTVLRLPRQDYYRKSLTCLEGAGVGVRTQVPGFAAFHVWRRLPVFHGSFDSILRLAHTHSFFMFHTRFDFVVWACHCGRATFCKGWPGSEVSGDLIQLVCP
ncbi:hypothetical protein F2Q70_00038515 [Brassica cretica]|uniref:Uncharacterized protein n=1 Tax=Brassica cretica TaxID=69181 RepID=A0A8S9MKK7_BRACR|nr:hypothetical protein F2Q70_00038515 [Brassica cretica]KAF2620445.1 hypothetical protein F2Q68_00039146 [Brassica cretica]